MLLASAGFFSIAETAMMAVNRYRLKHRAQRGGRGAKLALSLLGRTDALLGVILLGNTLVAAGAATLTAVITKRLFGEGEFALAAGTVAISFALLVFSEITPKVVGAMHADRIAPIVSYILSPMLKAATPVVWFVNLFVQALLKLLRIRRTNEAGSKLTQEELRSLVLEGQYFRGKHRALLANLLDLEAVSVDDVMTPRNQIHALDLAAKPALITQQLATSYHTRLPAYEDTLDNIVGVIHLKQVVHLLRDGEIDPDGLRSILRPAYFVPAGTPLLAQLQQFQNDHERLGLVVDEYGELVGPRDDRGHHRGDHRRLHDAGARRDGHLPARRRRHRRRGRPRTAPHAEPQARHALSGRRAQDAQRSHPRSPRRHSRRGHPRGHRRTDARGAADAGPWRKGRTPAGARGPGARRAFTKRRRAGIIGRISFMRLE